MHSAVGAWRKSARPQTTQTPCGLRALATITAVFGVSLTIKTKTAIISLSILLIRPPLSPGPLFGVGAIITFQFFCPCPSVVGRVLEWKLHENVDVKAKIITVTELVQKT